jgi:iron complex outermembrane recepter protein
LQWRPSDELEFYFGGLYTYETRAEERSRIQMDWSRGDIISGVVDPETNTLVAAVIDRHRTDQDTLFRDTELDSQGITGGFIWDNDEWQVTGEVSMSSGAEDWFQSQALARVNRDGVASFDMRPNFRNPQMSTPAILRDPEDIGLRDLRRQHRIIGYDEDVLRLDAKRELDTNFFTSVEMGVRFTKNEFDRKQGVSPASVDAGDLTFADGNTTTWGLQDDLGFGEGPAGFPRRWAVVDPDSLIEQYPLEDAVIPFNNDGVYRVDEDTSAAYFMGNFQHLFEGFKAQGNIGVRVIKTKVDGVGNVNITTEEGAEVLVGEPTTLDKSYTEALPSFNMVLAPTGDGADYLIRGAITKALTRPTVGEMRPQVDINTEDLEISRGNPALDPFLAWQYDLGFEFYFGENSEGLFSITAFVKDVENFITPVSVSETVGFPDAGIPSDTYTVDTYANGGNADIKGVEVSLQSPFTFLPDFWSNFGGMLNYTYIDSEFIDENGASNPFPGTSENTFNAILFYEDGGFSTRFAYNYRDDFLQVPNSSGRNREFVEGTGRLDIGIRYRWESGWKLAIDAINVTEEDQYHYFDVPTRLVDYTFETMTLNVSMGYKF